MGFIKASRVLVIIQTVFTGIAMGFMILATIMLATLGTEEIGNTLNELIQSGNYEGEVLQALKTLNDNLDVVVIVFAVIAVALLISFILYICIAKSFGKTIKAGYQGRGHLRKTSVIVWGVILVAFNLAGFAVSWVGILLVLSGVFAIIGGAMLKPGPENYDNNYDRENNNYY